MSLSFSIPFRFVPLRFILEIAQEHQIGAESLYLVYIVWFHFGMIEYDLVWFWYDWIKNLSSEIGKLHKKISSAPIAAKKL
jgi:hypothetical protein